ncbi:unnamed protein product [Zymoseptoria tritici ST99CH_3D7]|uniref:TRUD domain-containing protein n=1 Tax=Zymoseptoria tritici (strain ST99CH_3D7) TaxID=1276538 RepID=A0A1X7RK99_ZYMT9|nr:unnamed protein product [Zymoseptoria tritici ST99CH_3D7]
MATTKDASVADDPSRDQGALERAVGISVYVTPDAPGFSCIVKQRYTDFLVNEVLPNGDVLHPSDLEPEDRKRKRGNDGGAAQKKQRTEEKAQFAEAVKTEPKIEEDMAVKFDAEATPAAAAKTEESGVKAEQDSAPDSDAARASDPVKAAKAEAVASISEKDLATLKDVFGESTTSAIVNLYASVVAQPERKPRDLPTIESEPISQKSKRTEAHICVRNIFKSKLSTLTVQDQDRQSGPGTIIAIKAAPPSIASDPNGDARHTGQQRGKQGWADLGGEYLHFTLYKENKDTMEVLYFLASQMKLHVKNFSFAGTKDRRGVTVQRVAVHKVKRDRIESLNRFARGWRLTGPWEHKKTSLELGELNGNQFLLTLRDARFDGEEADWTIQQRLQHAKSVANTAAERLSTQGFLNYYGLQRFGTHSTGTHAIGEKILSGDLKGAVDSLLSYEDALLEENQAAESGAFANGDGGRGQKKVPYDDIARATGIRDWRKTGNVRDALGRIPGRFSAERGIITHLGKRDHKTGARPAAEDWQGALMQIQRNLRLMYVHAYQSYVWNTVVGKRWEIFGNTVVEGDLVVVGEKEQQEGIVRSVPADEVDEHGEPIIHPSASAGGETGAGVPTSGAADDPFVRARPLSRDEVKSGRFTIFDLVLPLPGFDVIYPKNEIGQFYVDFMASEQGGGLNPHKMYRAWKDISLSGGYRKMMTRPLGRVEAELRIYSRPDEQLVQTDMEKLEGAKVSHVKAETGDNATGDKLAVLLKLQLGSSQYATMAIRELSKGGASSFTPDFASINK